MIPMLCRCTYCLTLFALLPCAVLATGCRQSVPASSEAETPAEEPWFEDVTAKLGIDFVHDPGPLDGTYFMPQIMASGAALFDCDNDGRLDVYLLQNGGPDGARNRLYRQRADGS